MGCLPTDIIGNFPATRFRSAHHEDKVTSPSCKSSRPFTFVPIYSYRDKPQGGRRRSDDKDISMKQVFSHELSRLVCVVRVLPQHVARSSRSILRHFFLPPCPSVSAGRWRIILADMMTNTNGPLTHVGDPEDIQPLTS